MERETATLCSVVVAEAPVGNAVEAGSDSGSWLVWNHPGVHVAEPLDYPRGLDGGGIPASAEAGTFCCCRLAAQLVSALGLCRSGDCNGGWESSRPIPRVAGAGGHQ